MKLIALRPSRPKVKIAVAQMNCTEDKDTNWHQLEGLVTEAAQAGAKVGICNPMPTCNAYSCSLGLLYVFTLLFNLS